jgi:sterol desaturase/sphingolipid hydroxylase (fatty acid hydroxylase superfamily)
VNILWAGHMTHHSSEHYNFSNSFRTSLFQGVNRILFWSILPVFGFSPVMLVVLLKISQLYDFLLHTEAVPKLGILEKILVTPSQHRVHHGRNDLYINRNYGSTFVVWDKLFGPSRKKQKKWNTGSKGLILMTIPTMRSAIITITSGWP